MTHGERTATMRTDNPSGGYAFLPSDLRFASGAVAALAGLAIDHAAFPTPVPLDDGFKAIERHLDQVGRPRAALCGVEVRSPESLPWGQFDAFNERYFAHLAAWDLLRDDGTSPLARTNVAPFVGPPDQAGVVGFSYTIEAEDAEPTFVVSGVAELREPYRMPDDVVRPGETTPDALLDKARGVIEMVVGRLADLGVAWTDAATVHVYSGRDIAHPVKRELLAIHGVNPTHGIVWHDTSPPVLGLELEIDVRHYRRELSLAGGR